MNSLFENDNWGNYLVELKPVILAIVTQTFTWIEKYIQQNFRLIPEVVTTARNYSNQLYTSDSASWRRLID